jgi:L-asparaginase II
MLETQNPVLVQVWRGDGVESRHRGAAVVAEAGGDVVAAWGDAARPVFPRSSLKPVQALALVETGAWRRFGLGPEELALASASHSGSARHVTAVAAWLARLGLSQDDLECGSHAPIDAGEAEALIRAGRRPCPLHNNCSGKHAGFLTVARHLGVSHGGYIEPGHPVQRRVSAAIAEMSGHDLSSTPCAVDGCGIPTHALPLAALATAMARMARPGALGTVRGEAATAIVAAMRAHPDLVAGAGRLCTAVMATAPDIAVKGGAEGVYVAIVPERGWGVAVKIDDGAARAAEVAVLAVLRRMGILSVAVAQALESRLRPRLFNVAGTEIGEIRPAPELG